MKQLIDLARTGDEQAFEQLVQLHKSKLTATAFSYMKDYAAAQDVVQETFLKAHQSLQQLKDPAYFSTWLFKILIRQCFHVLKRQKRDAEIQFEHQQLLTLQDAHPAHYDELYAAVNLLKEHYKTVILLHYFYDFKLQEIAHLLGKPLNTIKIQLHRARMQLKSILETTYQKPINQQDVKTMLKQQLKEAALRFLSVPFTYELAIEDVNEESATFLWKDGPEEEGYYIELSPQGNLRSFTQPTQPSETILANEELQRIAEQFMVAQYPEALQYFTFSKVKSKPDSKRYYYNQLVAGLPLTRSYCNIEVANSGQVVNFEFKPYMETPPQVPTSFADTAPILEQLRNSEWTAELEYLSTDYYSVPQSGLYVVYDSSHFFHSFDAATGRDFLAADEDDEPEFERETYVPFPTVVADEPLASIEEIIGLTPNMERVRQGEIDDGYVGVVWRDREIQPPTEKTMDQFILDRFEHTVKATFNETTGELNGFVWFKDRNGELDLSFGECEMIAAKFIKTYFPQFVPFLKMKVQEPSFNDANRAFFSFSIFVNGFQLGREWFMVSVNKTTGLVDMLMAPKMDVELLTSYQADSLLSLEEAKKALEEVDAVLEWDTRYEFDEPIETLVYRYVHRESKEKIKGIDAVSGKIITSAY